MDEYLKHAGDSKSFNALETAIEAAQSGRMHLVRSLRKCYPEAISEEAAEALISQAEPIAWKKLEKTISHLPRS